MKCETKWISKTNRVFWICTCFLCCQQLGCDVDNSYQKRLTHVGNDNTIYLTLHSSIGWELMVFPEGSGRLSYSATRGESLTFAKGTFDYKKLIDQMMKGVSPEKPTGPYLITVTFGLSELDNAKVDYLANPTLAKSIFDQAYTGVLSSNAPVYNKRRLKKKYRKKPPVALEASN